MISVIAGVKVDNRRGEAFGARFIVSVVIILPECFAPAETSSRKIFSL